MVSAEESGGLAGLFANPGAEQHVMRGAAHHVPSRAEDTRAICEFLERQQQVVSADDSKKVDKNDGTILCAAVAAIELAQVTTLLESGYDANGIRAPGGEESFQPDQPLKMVMFRLSDCYIDTEQEATFAEIAKVLLRYGADPKPAMHIAEVRYGPYSKEDHRWEAWDIIATAAAPVQD
jgi:hypothetical protein